jgi:lysophospholipase L1-like esterase
MALLKKLIKLTKDIWTILGITLVMLVATEAGCSLAFYVRGLWHTPAENFRIKADTYSDSSWAVRYYQEVDEIERGRSMRWHSYTYWRRMPRRGEYININADGLRRTSNVVAPKVASSTMRVFMFGGSTMWGLGAGDEFTIPSIFAKEANNKGIICEVTNFGQYAYVSTQGVIELMLQLQKGNIPDVVIFYDGVNDAFGAFQLGVPGLPYDEVYREKEFLLLKKNELKTSAVQSVVNQLSIVRFLNGSLKKLGLRRDNVLSIPMEYGKPISDRKALSRAVVETYFNNIKLVRALSKSYGFTCIFYWQPVIYLKQHLTEYERRSLEIDVNYPGMKEFYLDTYAFLKQRAAGLESGVPFHDISSIFSEMHDPIYVDFNHMGDKGNSLIAQRMIEDFVRIIKPNGKAAGRGDAP